MVGISYQLYSSRRQPLSQTLSMLSGLGYEQVEGYGALFKELADPAELKAQLEEAGLTMPTAHIGLDIIEADPKGVAGLANEIGIGTVFVPAVPKEQRPEDAEGWQTLGRRLALAGKPLQNAGLGFGWHNHDFEFATLDAAERPLDLILAGGQDLAFEIDVAWVQVAGEDPLAWIAKYSDRIVAAHVKDIAPPGEAQDEDGWADPGHGVMDWPAIAAALRKTRCEFFIMEHDNPSDDARFARRAIETGKGL
jgi:sugar phosphate isomerase/epimerase